MKMNDEINNLSTTHFCDVSNDVFIFSPDLKPVSKVYRMIGSAFTIQTNGDLLPIIEGIESAPKNSVLVVNTFGSPKAVAGEIFSFAAKANDLSGIIIDGYCRDPEGIQNSGLPFFAKGITPCAGSKTDLGIINEPTMCGGVNISPGDIIFSDRSGIISIPKSVFPNILDKAKKLQLTEEEALKSIINKRKKLKELFNFSEHYGSIKDLLSKTVFSWSRD